jgi:hypothetical protein
LVENVGDLLYIRMRWQTVSLFYKKNENRCEDKKREHGKGRPCSKISLFIKGGQLLFI